MLGFRDSLLTQTGALPNAASSSTNTSALDLGVGAKGENVLECVEFEVDAPALNTTQLPNTTTVTYDVIISASSNLGTPTVLHAAILTQTGAGGVGAAAASIKFRLPFSLNAILAGARYIGVRANTSAGTGNCSAASVQLNVNS